MIFSSQDQWLNLQGEFAQYESDILWCDKKLEIEISFSNILDNSSKALVELEIETCLSDLFIYNKFSAEEIIINFKESEIKLGHIEIFGPAASITMLSNKDAFFSNVITKNIHKITYISGNYKGLTLGSSDLTYDKVNAQIFINNWHNAGLIIEGAKVILAGEIKAFPILSINLYGTKQQDYSLYTSNLILLNTDILNILDVTESKFGIKLFGNILALSNSTIQGKNLILANSTLTSLKIDINLQGSGEFLGVLQSSAINITSSDLVIKDNGLINSVSFQKENYLYPAKTINLNLKNHFICSENGKIISDAKIIVNIGKNFNFDCVGDAKNSIIFKGNVQTAKITNNATIISRQGDIAFNLNNNENFVMDGLIVAQQGAIKYIAGKKFISNGITAGINGISILQAQSNLLTVEINQFSEVIDARWRTIINSTEHKVTASLISFGNQIVIQSKIIHFNKEASILNVLSENVKTIISSETKITADSYIHHNASIFITNGNVIEKANGKNKDGFGVIFAENSHIESETGKILVDSTNNIKFEGNITAYDLVSIEALCLENYHNSAINSLSKNTKIKLKQCHFINNGVIYSGSTLSLTVAGGDIENKHVIASNDLKIHGDKNFINYAHILSHNNAKIGLGINGRILLKPESVMYVGSYDLGHFSEMYRVRIGEVDCHGCSIKTIKPVTSIVSADILSVRITHYEKTPYQQIAQHTFRVDEWKERHYARIGPFRTICTGVSHHWRDATLTLYENHHDYYGPAHISHAGDLILDAGSVIVDKSYIGGEGRLNFPYASAVTIISEQAEKKLVASRGDITHMNPQDRVKNAFGLAAADVAYNWGNIVITQPTDKVNSVFYFKEGITGNFQKIELGNSKSYFGSISNAVLPATDSSAPAKIIADITIDNASKGKTVIVYNWKIRNNELEIITPEQLQNEGFEISKLIHPRIINSKIFDSIVTNKQDRIADVNNEDTLTIQPIFFLKSDPLLASFINEPLNLVHFLTNLAFNQKGLIYTIGDGHFISKLVDEAVFILLGVLTSVNNNKLLQSLALNAISEQSLQNLIAGNPLTSDQIKALTSSIIWPVWRDNFLGDEKCLDFKLYFNNKALKDTLSGAAMVSEGDIDLKIIGDALIGLNGQIKSDKVIKLDLKGNMVNLGNLNSIKGIDISAKNIGNAGRINVVEGDLKLNAIYDIINLGSTIIQKGNAYLKAGHDIKELILINPASPVPELTKRSIYAIGGSLYYDASNDITQQTSVIFASGDIKMIAGHDIKIETIHHSRIIKEEHSRRHYLIQSTIDQYDAIIMVNGSVIMNAGNNFIGSGIKLSSSESDINVNAENKAIFQDNTDYAWNYEGRTKSKFLGKSSVDVAWTTSQTAKIEITAPGGRIYVSSKDCTLEGGVFEGQKPIFKCSKLIAKPHIVKNKVITTTIQSGLFTPRVPAYDLTTSKNPEMHLRENTIANQMNSLINMQGPLDLLPAVNLISTIPGLKADYKLLEGAGLPPHAAIVGALLSKYIAASISIGKIKTTTSFTQTTSDLPKINGHSCQFEGKTGEIAANINCEEKVDFTYDNLKFSGAKNTLQVASETTSSSFDLGVSLTGVSFGVSFSQGNMQHDQVVHNSGTIYSKNISIKVNEKLEIENAQINGKNVTVDALTIEIKQVIDSSCTKSQSSGGSIGATVTWTGAIIPSASIDYSKAVQQSQVVGLLSGITGESVEVTTERLIYNIEAISAEKNLNIKAESLEYIGLPQVENIDTEIRLSASISARSDGESNYVASIYNRDGNQVMSVGYNSAFKEGLQIAKEYIADKLQKQQDSIEEPQEQEINNEDKKGENEFIDKKRQIKLEVETDGEVGVSQEAYSKHYRTKAEYQALKRKGIMVNDQMSYNDDAIDGEFLSKLNEYEFDIDVLRNKVTVFLGIDSKGNVAFKEYDLTSADSLRVKYASAENNDIWNQKYQISLSEQMKIQREAALPYETFKKNELNRGIWKSYALYKKSPPIHSQAYLAWIPEELTKYSLVEDSDLEHYLRSKYDNYIQNGETSTSLTGFKVHQAGILENYLEVNYPKTTKVIGNTYDGIILPFEIFGEYFFVPFIKGSSKVGGILLEIAIGKESAEYIHQKEREFWNEVHKYYDKIERDCTPEQKEALSFTLKAAEATGAGKLYKDLAKTSLRNVIKSKANKIDSPDVKKSDSLNMHGKTSPDTHDNVDGGAGKVKHHGDVKDGHSYVWIKRAPNLELNYGKQGMHIEGHKAVRSDFHPTSNNINKASSDIPSTSHYQHTFATTHSPSNFHSKKTNEIITPSNIHQTPLKMEVESQTIHGISKEASNKIDDVIKKGDNFDELNAVGITKTRELTEALSELEKIIEKDDLLHGVIFEESYSTLKQLLQDGPYKIIATHDSKDINRLVAKWGFDDPPHHVFYPAVEVVTTTQTKNLVRVFSYDAGGRPSGSFLTPRSQIEGLTDLEIKIKLALDFIPTHIADANLPKDVKLFVSIVGNNYGQPGGAIQMQIAHKLTDTQRQTWFNNVRELK